MWKCDKCDYTICAWCRPPHRRSIETRYCFCPKKHLLQKNYIHEAPTPCSLCRRSSSPVNYICKTCNDYRVCAFCRPVEELPPEASLAETTQCPESHFLSWSTESEGYPNGIYICNTCRNSDQCSKGRFTCNACKYNVCNLCRPLSNHSLIPLYGQCNQDGQHLVFTKEPAAKSETFTCGVCKTERKKFSDGCYGCAAKCGYAVCRDCRPPPEDIMDNIGNKLKWSTETKKTGKKYKCIKCNAIKKSSAGRWSNEDGKVNYCGRCRKPIGFFAYYRLSSCPNNHSLNWSTNANSPAEQYICKKCLTSKFSSLGRWSCAKCNYNLCPSCKLPSTSFAFCEESNHRLTWAFSHYNYPNK